MNTYPLKHRSNQLSRRLHELLRSLLNLDIMFHEGYLFGIIRLTYEIWLPNLGKKTTTVTLGTWKKSKIKQTTYLSLIETLQI